MTPDVLAEVHLRCHSLSEDRFPHLHRADVLIGLQPPRWDDDPFLGRYLASVDDLVTDDDPRWPTECECGYEFGIDDKREVAQVLNG